MNDIVGTLRLVFNNLVTLRFVLNIVVTLRLAFNIVVTLRLLFDTVLTLPLVCNIHPLSATAGGSLPLGDSWGHLGGLLGASWGLLAHMGAPKGVAAPLKSRFWHQEEVLYMFVRCFLLFGELLLG